MSQKVVVGVVFVAAMFMSIMDATIVNVALPTIGRDFGVSPTAVDSISIAYLVSLAVFIPASGWLGDRFGGKRVMLAAIAVFTAASALCGLASSLGELVAFRILQGAGRRHARPGRDGHAVPRVPARGADQGRGHPHRAHHVRPGARAGAGRAAGHRPVLAVGVLRQPAARRGGVRLRPAVPTTAKAGPAGPVRPGRLPAVRAGSGAADVRRLGGARTWAGISRKCSPPSRPGSCCWPPW